MKPELDRKNSLVNLGNSVLKKYGVKQFHSSIPEIDEILSKTNKNVCLILLDGFGSIIMEKHKEYCPFIYSHIFHKFKSIYPPTTVAATNGLLLARYPTETGFTGWLQYFSDLDKYVNVFPSTEAITNELITPPVRENHFINHNIIDMINDTGKFKAHQVMAMDFEIDHNLDIDALFNEADNTMSLYDFTYLYCTEPDHTMHGFGTESHVISELAANLDNHVKNLVERHPETLFMLVADHGMTDVSILYLEDYPEFYDSLEDKIVNLEGRFASFKVRDKDKFLREYEKHFKDYFEIYTGEEILNEEIFGPKENITKVCKDQIGDYFLLAKDHYSFGNTKGGFVMLGNHAGITSDETNINLCAFNLD